MAARSEKLDLRLSQADKHMLTRAAAAQRRSVSDFVLDSALRRAQECLPDRSVFRLNAEQWTAFMAALEAPPRPLPRLERAMREKSVFEASAPE